MITKTDDLIMDARRYLMSAENTKESALIELLSDRLQTACEDIYINCCTCANYPCQDRRQCFGNSYKDWQWRGDEE